MKQFKLLNIEDEQSDLKTIRIKLPFEENRVSNIYNIKKMIYNINNNLSLSFYDVRLYLNKNKTYI